MRLCLKGDKGLLTNGLACPVWRKAPPKGVKSSWPARLAQDKHSGSAAFPEWGGDESSIYSHLLRTPPGVLSQDPLELKHPWHAVEMGFLAFRSFGRITQSCVRSTASRMVSKAPILPLTQQWQKGACCILGVCVCW